MRLNWIFAIESFEKIPLYFQHRPPQNFITYLQSRFVRQTSLTNSFQFTVSFHRHYFSILISVYLQSIHVRPIVEVLKYFSKIKWIHAKLSWGLKNRQWEKGMLKNPKSTQGTFNRLWKAIDSSDFKIQEYEHVIRT